MLKLTKIIGISFAVLGALALASATFASPTLAEQAPAESLQPASSGGVGQFDSLRVGSQGTGGVTYFNGSIVNSTTGDSGSDNPVAFGDNVRIDGYLQRGTGRTNDGMPVWVGDDARFDGVMWGGPKKGNTADGQSLVMADAVRPAMDDTNDFGSAGYRWKNGYFTRNLSAGMITTTGDATIGGDISTTYDIIAGNDLHVGSSADVVGDLIVSGNADVTKNLTVNGDVNVTGVLVSESLRTGIIDAAGDVNQSLDNSGAIKVLVAISTSLPNDCNLQRSWTFNDTAVSCTHTSNGIYNITFDFDISNRYFQVTSDDQDGSPRITNGTIVGGGNTIMVSIASNSGTLVNSGLMLTIY